MLLESLKQVQRETIIVVVHWKWMRTKADKVREWLTTKRVRWGTCLRCKKLKRWVLSQCLWTIIKFLFILRLDNFYNNHSLSATWFQQLQLVECLHGFGLVALISKTFARYSLRPHFISTRLPSTRKTMTFTIKNSLQKLNIHSIPTRPLMFCDTFWKVITFCHGLRWTLILTTGFHVYQFMYKC